MRCDSPLLGLLWFGSVVIVTVLGILLIKNDMNIVGSIVIGIGMFYLAMLYLWVCTHEQCQSNTRIK